MRKAVKAFETAEYWKHRAAAAIRHAVVTAIAEGELAQLQPAPGKGPASAEPREAARQSPQGLFVDQRWIDFVPAYFDHTVLLDEGYNVAYWNLFEREFKRGADGYEVNGRPLRFYHYSGFDPLRRYALSKHQVGEMRIRLQDNFDLAQLCSRYADQLLASGHVEASALAYRYNYTAGGIGIAHSSVVVDHGLRDTRRP